jgi:hypothetical protein
LYVTLTPPKKNGRLQPSTERKEAARGHLHAIEPERAQLSTDGVCCDAAADVEHVHWRVMAGRAMMKLDFVEYIEKRGLGISARLKDGYVLAGLPSPLCNA